MTTVDSMLNDDPVPETKSPFDGDPVEELRREIERLKERMEAADYERLSEEERTAKRRLERLCRQGFTPEQAQGILLALVEEGTYQSINRLTARRKRHEGRGHVAEAAEGMPDFDEAGMLYGAPMPSMRGIHSVKPRTVWDELTDALPAVAAGLPAALAFVLPLLRRKEEEPPRPWWQTQIRRVLGCPGSR